ncbi:MAG TPA: hypothetical protein VNU71_00545 [Burkholderiaceae bacterium]|nr:hypothetical protein [Burkholderiaceae bacterium]
MRAAPPIQVSLQRFGVWQGAVLALALAGGVAIGAWLAGRERPIDARSWAIAAVAWTGIAALTWPSLRLAPRELRWDGRVWHLGPIGGEPVVGALRVAIDAGAWMLVRFEAPGQRAAWLPVQRRGLEPQWHALRCAVHSPQPSDTDAAEIDA